MSHKEPLHRMFFFFSLLIIFENLVSTSMTTRINDDEWLCLFSSSSSFLFLSNILQSFCVNIRETARGRRKKRKKRDRMHTHAFANDLLSLSLGFLLTFYHINSNEYYSHFFVCVFFSIFLSCRHRPTIRLAYKTMSIIIFIHNMYREKKKKKTITYFWMFLSRIGRLWIDL